MSLKIPFFSNLPDDMHCMQSCMRMALKYYFPDKDFSFEQIDALIGLGKRKLWSTPVQAVVAFDDFGLNTKCYAAGDFEKYLREGVNYIKKNYKNWKTILKHIDVNLDMKFIREALKRKLLEMKKLQFDEIESFFKKGNIIMLAINTNVFKGKKGYVGHFVLITDIGNDYVEFHDPGLPPIPRRRESKDNFIQSWYDHDTDRSALVVFGKRL